MTQQAQIGKGGGHGGGGHGGGHGHGGGGLRRGGRGGGWGYGSPWAAYDIGPSAFDIDLLLSAADDKADSAADTKALASEVVRQLKGKKATVGSDLDLLDAEVLGEGSPFGDFGISSIFQTAGNIAETGVKLIQADQAKGQAEALKGKAAEEEQKKLASAIAADAAATQAAARAAWTTGQKLPSAAVDQSAVTQTAAAQARAAAGLSPASIDKRLDAANAGWAQATQTAQKNPKDPYSRALVDAWQQTVNRIQNAQITGQGPAPAAEASGKGGKGGGKGGAAGSDGEGGGIGGWLSGKTGPVPNKMIAGGGALAAVALVLRGLLR